MASWHAGWHCWGHWDTLACCGNLCCCIKPKHKKPFFSEGCLYARLIIDICEPFVQFRMSSLPELICGLQSCEPLEVFFSQRMLGLISGCSLPLYHHIYWEQHQSMKNTPKINRQQNRHFNVFYVCCITTSRQNACKEWHLIEFSHLPLNLTTTTYTKMSWHFILHMLEHYFETVSGTSGIFELQWNKVVILFQSVNAADKLIYIYIIYIVNNTFNLIVSRQFEAKILPEALK